MIYEIRTYRIAPGSLAEVEKRYGEAYEYRKKHSALTAFLHTEIGPLNEIVHIWGYRDLAERARIRGEAAKDANWPPKIREFVRAMRSEALARRARRGRRIRHGQRLRAYLGVLEPRCAREGAGRGEAEGRLAAAGRIRPAADAGEQDSPALRLLAAAVVSGDTPGGR